MTPVAEIATTATPDNDSDDSLMLAVAVTGTEPIDPDAESVSDDSAIDAADDRRTSADAETLSDDSLMDAVAETPPLPPGGIKSPYGSSPYFVRP
jgi:hypothetical protein